MIIVTLLMLSKTYATLKQDACIVWISSLVVLDVRNPRVVLHARSWQEARCIVTKLNYYQTLLRCTHNWKPRVLSKLAVKKERLANISIKLNYKMLHLKLCSYLSFILSNRAVSIVREHYAIKRISKAWVKTIPNNRLYSRVDNGWKGQYY